MSGSGRAMTRALAAAPIASFAFASILALAAVAVSKGLIADDALRLWAGASTAAELTQAAYGKKTAAQRRHISTSAD